MQFNLSKNKFVERGTWGIPLENQVCPHPSFLDRFDQSGYDLCRLEQEYALVNIKQHDYMRYHACIKKEWFVNNDYVSTGVHINHADLYERKGYHGYALEQLSHWAPGNNLLWKMIKMRPKWGIDISLDFVDQNGNVMELFHFEWDDHHVWTVQEMKYHIEEIVHDTDWDRFAQLKLDRKHEWKDLDFVGQSAWTTKILGLPKERFKLIPWKT